MELGREAAFDFRVMPCFMSLDVVIVNEDDIELETKAISPIGSGAVDLAHPIG